MWASLVAQTVEFTCNPWIGRIPWRRTWQPTSVFLPGESPWTEEPGGLVHGVAESDTTERPGTELPTLSKIKNTSQPVIPGKCVQSQ